MLRTGCRDADAALLMVENEVLRQRLAELEGKLALASQGKENAGFEV